MWKINCTGPLDTVLSEEAIALWGGTYRRSSPVCHLTVSTRLHCHPPTTNSFKGRSDHLPRREQHKREKKAVKYLHSKTYYKM